ncbi:MAG: DUF6491 family protein [Pseudomonadales bacterium]
MSRGLQDRRADGGFGLRCLGAALASLLLLVASGQASGQSAETVSEDAPLDLETILGTTAGQDEYVESPRCLPRARIDRVDVLDERHLVFRLSRDEKYLVVLRSRCPGLYRRGPVAYESGDVRLCALDSVRAMNVGSYAANLLGPPCQIPEFRRISDEQLELLDNALGQTRR